MKNCLLLLAMVGMVLIGAPAQSQYLFLDTNGDGLNSLNPATPPSAPDDILVPSVTSVDVYFVTDQNADGSAAVCELQAVAFDISSYEFILRASGGGNVVYGGWTDNTGFANGGVLCGNGTVCTAGSDIWIGKYQFSYVPAGKIKVGTLAVTVTGVPKLDFATSTTLNSAAGTSFGSRCPGSQGDYTIRLGQEFPNAFGTESTNPVTSTTWGKIKSFYQ